MTAPSPITDTYNELHGLIAWTVTQFWKRFGGDLDDMMSEANLKFMTVYEKWDAAKGIKLATLLKISIERQLHSRRNFFIRRKAIRTTLAFDPPAREKTPSLTEQLETAALSIDAKTILTYIFENASELKAFPPSQIRRKVLKPHFEKAGWDKDRINQAFLEIELTLPSLC
jgi:hypothetical protein